MASIFDDHIDAGEREDVASDHTDNYHEHEYHGPSYAKDHWKNLFTDEEDAFYSFMCLPKTYEAMWGFYVSQCDTKLFRGCKPPAGYRTLRRRAISRLPKMKERCIMENLSTNEIREFETEDEFPAKDYPVAEWRELYRETRANLDELGRFWASTHKDSRCDELRREIANGKRF